MNFHEVPKNQVLFDEEFGLLTSIPNSREVLKKISRTFSYIFSKGLLNFCASLLPILQWLPHYNIRKSLISDIIGGLTVGIMNVPQSLAYASLVGLEPIHGLYTSFFPPLFYMFFASSRLSSIGVSAVISLLVGRVNVRVMNQFRSYSHLVGNASVTTEMPVFPIFRPIDVAMALTLTVGLIQISMAMLRLDFLTTYMSDQVIRGFTTGAALHVLVSQLDKIFGVQLSRHEGFLRLFKTIRDIMMELPYANPVTALTSAITLIALYLCKNKVAGYVKKFLRFPIPFDLIVVVVGALMSYLLEMETKYHVKVVGNIPLGLPAPSVPNITIIPYVIADAVTIAVIILAVAVSMGKLFAKKYHYPFDVRQEFYAVAITECGCSLFPCWTASIALARSLVNDSAGTKTQLSIIFSSLLTLLVIYVLSPLMRMLPMCFLACIIIVALRGMFIQFADLKRLWHISKYDFAVWIVAFLATVLFDVIQGLVAGIVFALFTIILRTQWQKTTVLGRMCHDNGLVYYRPLHRYRDARPVDKMICIQIDGPVLFINACSVKECCLTAVRKHSTEENYSTNIPVHQAGQTVSENSETSTTAADYTTGDDCQMFSTTSNISNTSGVLDTKYAIIDLTTVTYIDDAGAKALTEIYSEMKKISVSPLFCNTSYAVLHTLSKCELDGKPPATIFFPSVEDARKAVHLLTARTNPARLQDKTPFIRHPFKTKYVNKEQQCTLTTDNEPSNTVTSDDDSDHL